MGTNVERVERYLRGVAAPKYVSERHRQQLRRRILGGIGNRRTIPASGRLWRIAAAAVILVCLVGTLGTLLDTRYRSVGRPADGMERFISQDTNDRYTVSTAGAEANGAIEVVQTAKEPGEADLLPEQDDIEVVLVGANKHSPAQVIELEAIGRPDSRTPLHYTIAKGRRNVVGVNHHSLLLTSLSPADWVELSQLRQAGKGEALDTQERQWKGRAFVFQRERYTLRNGTRIIVSTGAPKEAP